MEWEGERVNFNRGSVEWEGERVHVNREKAASLVTKLLVGLRSEAPLSHVACRARVDLNCLDFCCSNEVGEARTVLVCSLMVEFCLL